MLELKSEITNDLYANLEKEMQALHDHIDRLKHIHRVRRRWNKTVKLLPEVKSHNLMELQRNISIAYQYNKSGIYYGYHRYIYNYSVANIEIQLICWDLMFGIATNMSIAILEEKMITLKYQMKLFRN